MAVRWEPSPSIGEDREQNIWAVANPDRKLYRIRDMRVQEEFSPPQIPIPRLVAADPSGGVWLGFVDSFGRYRDGKVEIIAQNSAGQLVGRKRWVLVGAHAEPVWFAGRMAGFRPSRPRTG